MSLSLRMFLAITAVLALVLGGTGWLSVREEEAALEAALDKRGETIASALAAFTVEGLVSQDYPALENALALIGRRSPGIEYIEVSRSGQVVARFGAAAAQGRMFSADILVGMGGAQTKPLGNLKVLLSERDNREVIAAREREVARNMLLVFVALAIALRYLLRVLVLRPIENLTVEAEHLVQGSGISPSPGTAEASEIRDEIGRLRERLLALRQGNNAQAVARSQALAQVDEAMALLADVADTLPFGLLCLDTSGRIVQCNLRAAELVGARRNKVAGRLLVEGCPPLKPLAQKILAAVAARAPAQWQAVPFPSGPPVNVSLFPLSEASGSKLLIRLDPVQ